VDNFDFLMNRFKAKSVKEPKMLFLQSLYMYHWSFKSRDMPPYSKHFMICTALFVPIKSHSFKKPFANLHLAGKQFEGPARLIE
jgi:hypothetical protein